MKIGRIAALIAMVGLIGLGVSRLHAQSTPAAANTFQALRWRNIGPDRGGRVTTVAGLVHDRMTYYMGATGGGVWKTTDAGITWTNISDRYFKTGSVGSVAVSESDPNTIYVGMGEACLRSNISHGDGMYKSSDAGRTWSHIGLDDSSQIGKVLIDPRDANSVYVAAVGHPYGENEMRGVFRTKDGGQSWQKVLFVDNKTGAADIVFDPHNSKTLYATTWQVHRYPWDIDEVGPGSGIWKSTDGGDNWTRLKAGLPATEMGKIGVTVSPVDTNRVWATIGGQDGGIYRSDDAGQTWQLLNGSFEMHSRQYYYGHIFADPKERDTVYSFCSKDFYKSTDGGKTYGHIQTPHGDYHDLWIDPNDNQRMVNGNDGGATVTFDGGKSWSSENNQPTAQFYTVRADNDFPYHVYGAQQDNTTVEIASDAAGGGRGAGGPAFSEVAGGESGYVVPDTQDQNMIYAGAYWGLLTRYDRRDGVTQNITVWPDYPGGRTGTETKYRFQWTFPIAVTPADPGVVYAGGNVVFKSTNKGRSWTPISGDLTRNDKERESKGRLEDVYDVVFTIAPSPVDKMTIWAGSDDGLIHVTRDAGKTWSDVTPKEIQPWTRVNVIEASPKDPATAYAAVNRYQMDDFHPYVYRTHDYGKTWTKIVSGIADNTFVRSVRQDPVRPQLLFAATETGVYASFDDGDHWQSIQLNLPVVPVTDMTIHDGDLLISTQGRAFWSLDNITPLEQMTPEATSAAIHLFTPKPTYRGAAGRGGRGGGGGGVAVDYYLASAAAGPVVLDFEDATGKSIKSFSSAQRAEGAPAGGRGGRGGGGGGAELPGTRAGLNRFSWDMRYPDAHGIDGGTFMLGGNLRGPMIVPGQYKVKLTVGDQTATQTFEVKKDPRVATTEADYRKQLELQLAARDKLSAADDAVNQIHGVQKQIAAALQKASSDASVSDAGKKLNDELDALANKFYEPNFTGFDDQTLVWSLKLNNRIAAMQNYSSGDFAPTEQAEAAFAQISKELDDALSQLKQTLGTQLPAFNAKITAMGIPAVKVEAASSSNE